ncbi:hypothetical protein, partial [Mesorhizobium sp. M7A.F.Ca.US.006.04.2.1]|uniref:hypothetical protein n=1 Tax=Mesorhizobium sp. M7A.F.Ca.US.006.04.2.1 TaxID=2496696 RepID=UPI0019D451EB
CDLLDTPQAWVGRSACEFADGADDFPAVSIGDDGGVAGPPTSRRQGGFFVSAPSRSRLRSGSFETMTASDTNLPSLRLRM